MNRFPRYSSAVLAFLVLFASCSSTTFIQSNPTKAKLYIDGAFVGETPYMHTDSKIVGSSMILKIEKEGYKPLITTITKDEEVDVGAVIGGLLCTVPFLWTMKYKEEHNYELMLLGSEDTTSKAPQTNELRKTKPEKLRELKQLLDDKIITNEDFEKEKTKILELAE